MSTGKDTCNYLKEIRRSIARESDIALEIPECTFKGECRGTCPQCESEVRFLENELAKKLSLGKVATVAGIALSIVTPAAAQSPNKEKELEPISIVSKKIDTNYVDTNNFMGMVKETLKMKPSEIDFSIKQYKGSQVMGGIEPVRMQLVCKVKSQNDTVEEPVPYATIICYEEDGRRSIGRQSDTNGEFSIPNNILYGIDKIEIECVGYKKVSLTRQQIDLIDTTKPIKITMVAGTTSFPNVIMGIINPIIEIGPLSTDQTIERDGMKVKVKY